MLLFRGLVFLGLILLVVFAATGAAETVPLVLNHQGRLLDASDHPISGTYTIIYQIYDAPVGGTLLWTEDHPGVQVTDGLFEVALGKTVPLTSDILAPGSGGGGGGGGAVRYLQITISGQPPISPRSPLTAAPYAVASSRVAGDIETSEGALKIRPDALSSSNIAIVSSDDADLFKVEAKPDSVKVKIRNHGGGDPDFDLLRIVGASGAGGGGQISITGDPDFDLLRMSAGKDSAKIRISGQSSGDPDFDLLRIAGGTGGGTAGASMTITGDPDFDLLRMSADHDSAKVRIGGKITGDPDFDLLSLSGGSGSSHMSMHSEPSSVGQKSHLLAADCDDASSHLSLESRVGMTVTQLHAGMRMTASPDSAVSVYSYDSDGDGVPESSIRSSSTATSAKHAINTKGTGTAGRSVRNNTDSLLAESSIEADVDGDGVADNSVSSTAEATTAKLAIKTKGTGAQRFSAGGDCDDTDASLHAEADADGDGVPDAQITNTCTPTTSSVAIKTKGTGAEANKTASLDITASPGGTVRAAFSSDVDGDSLPEGEISQSVTPTTSSVAIKTKGTGAEANKTASLTATASPGGSVSSIGVADVDGDGTNDEEISQTITPTSSSVAIQTKGTGADHNRSASIVCAADVDGDGFDDRQVSTTADSTTAGIAIDEPGVQIAMKVVNHGTVKGSINIMSGNRMIDLDSDGDGYFDHGIGVGVDPTHKIDVVGGAYCNGTNWVNASDANVKENFQTVNGEALLDQIDQLTISKWNYKGDAGVSHIGPTAQDFKAIFGVGSDGKSISTIDPAGIALAATKELRHELKDKTAQIDELQAKVQKLQDLVEKLLSEKK